MEKLVISSSNKAYVVNMDNIEFFEAKQCYTYINTSNGEKYLSSKPLKYYEELLKNPYFVRVHNKFIVNINHIREIEGGVPHQLFLTSTAKIPVTRFNKGEIVKLIMKNIK